jgi:hypothetical protein
MRAVLVAALNGTKLAVTLFGAFITRLCGFVLPVRSPEKDENWKFEPGVAVTVAVEPESYQPPPATVPPLVGLSEVVNWY